MERNNKIILLILLALAAAIILYPLIAHAIERNREVEEVKLETIEMLPEIATTTPPLEVKKIEKKEGSQSPVIPSSIASWYDYNLKDAPGYSKTNATAASRDYPRGSILLVTNVSTGATTTVRVNDYGPEAWTGRAIDLSSFAFSQIAPKSLGLVKVKIEKIK